MTDHVSACRCIWCASDPDKTALHPPVLAEQDYTGTEAIAKQLRDQIAEAIHCRICEHSREDCIENLGKCESATDSAMPLISTALDEGNAMARLLTGALNDASRTLRELAEKAAGEPIPFGDLDLYAEVVDGALDAADLTDLARLDGVSQG